MIKFSKTAFAVLLGTLILFTGCDQVKNTPNTVYIYTDGDDGGGTDPEPPPVPTNTITLSGPLNNMTLTADTIWILDGQVVVPSGVTLDIEPGTIIAGRDGTAANAGWLIVDANGTINAEGTEDAPIIFTSELAAVYGAADAEGQWGGLTIIGNAGNDQVDPYEVDINFVAGRTDLADNSGILKHVKVLNSGSIVGTDQELNGLSLVGVGSGTTIEDITVDLSGDDGIELWGGTVNLTNITITRAFDDQFDIDDGYSGTVTNLNITQTTGNAAIEMSGDTYATFNTFTIIQNTSSKEGGIYFKKDGIGGHFINGTVIDNSADGFGAIHSRGITDIANTSFTDVTLLNPSGDPLFTDDVDGGSSIALEAEFESGAGNTWKLATLNGPLNNMTLTADTIWILDGQVVVPSGVTLDIEPGTIIAGRDGTAANAGWLIVDANGTINAEGTEDAPIIFTSELAAVYGAADAEGQWGGLTIIGNAGNDQVDPYEVDINFVAGRTDLADNSGILKHVKVLNSGSIVGTDQELNGLSLVGVGSGTTIEDITVDLSGDDGIELWGGTVNLTNITITRAFDDQFDIDDGYSGTVTNLNITQTTGNAAIEMSGDTYATFNTFTIIQNTSSKEGGIYFKKDGIGGHFINGTVIDNSADGFGAIHSRGITDIANTSFTDVTLLNPSGDPLFTDDVDGGSSIALEAEFESGAGNSPNPVL